MLFSTTSSELILRVGAEAAVKMLIDAGFPCIDFSFEAIPKEIYTDSNATALAHRLRAMADAAGVTFNQSHAPFGRCTEYLERYVPLFPKAFEFAEILGVKTMVVHPRQTGIHKLVITIQLHLPMHFDKLNPSLHTLYPQQLPLDTILLIVVLLHRKHTFVLLCVNMVLNHQKTIFYHNHQLINELVVQMLLMQRL